MEPKYVPCYKRKSSGLAKYEYCSHKYLVSNYKHVTTDHLNFKQIKLWPPSKKVPICVSISTTQYSHCVFVNLSVPVWS